MLSSCFINEMIKCQSDNNDDDEKFPSSSLCLSFVCNANLQVMEPQPKISNQFKFKQRLIKQQSTNITSNLFLSLCIIVIIFANCLESNNSEQNPVNDSTTIIKANTKSSSELSLEYLALKSVPSRQFCLQTTWHQVNSLSLAHNQILQINSSAFSCVGLRLKILNLRRNRIEQISPDAFKQLHQLQVLLLDGNRLQQIPSESLNLLARSLRHLNLAYNRIESIGGQEEEEGEGEQNEESGGRQRALSEASWQISGGLETVELISLNLKGNPLVRLAPRAFKRLNKLRTLILSETRLTSATGHKLNSSTLSNVSIDSVSSPFEGLEQLRFLHLDRSIGHPGSLATIAGAFCRQSTQLASLVLRSSGLVEVPKFSNCKSLLLLDLAHNRLDGHLDGGLWRWQAQLLDLYLGHNQIESLGAQAFEGLVSLQVLELDHNRLRVIHLSAFVPLSASLIELNLAHNSKLSELPSAGLEQLQSFKSYGNYQLRQLPHLACAKLLALTYAYHCCDYCTSNTYTGQQLELSATRPTADGNSNGAQKQNQHQATNQMANHEEFSSLLGSIWRQIRNLFSPGGSGEMNNNGTINNDNNYNIRPHNRDEENEANDELEATRGRARAIDLSNLTELVIWPPISSPSSVPRGLRAPRAPNLQPLPRERVASANLIDHRPSLHLSAEIGWRLGSLEERLASEWRWPDDDDDDGGGGGGGGDYDDDVASQLLTQSREWLPRFRRNLLESKSEQFDHGGQLFSGANNYNDDGDYGDATKLQDIANGNHIKQPKQIVCSPQPNSFMPCQDLFDSWWLRASIWLVFSCAFLGNISVIIVLISVKSSSSSSALSSIMWLAHSRRHIDVPRFLVINLAIADLLMAIYLGLLACVDLASLGQFKYFAIKWQYSVGCQFAGFLAVLSSELSVFILAIITLERNYAITNAVHLNRRLSLQKAMLIMLLGYSFALVMAALPLNGISDYRKFSICLPLDAESNLASRYYVITLISINTFSFILLFSCYMRMYCAIRGSQAWNTNDLRIAKRMSILVLTDFLCWMPIICLACAALFGHQHQHLIGPRGLKVLTIFILPLNSVANPFLYAITTKKFKRDLATLRRRLASWLLAFGSLFWCSKYLSCCCFKAKNKQQFCTNRNCINNKLSPFKRNHGHNLATNCNNAHYNLKAGTKLMVQEQNFRKNLLSNNNNNRDYGRKRDKRVNQLEQQQQKLIVERNSPGGPLERQVILLKTSGPMIGTKLPDGGHVGTYNGDDNNNNGNKKLTVTRFAGKYLDIVDGKRTSIEQTKQAAKEQRLLFSNYNGVFGAQTNNMVTMNRTSLEDDDQACDDLGSGGQPALCSCQRSFAARARMDLGGHAGGSNLFAQPGRRQGDTQVCLNGSRHSGRSIVNDNEQKQAKPKIVLDLGSTSAAGITVNDNYDDYGKSNCINPSQHVKRPVKHSSSSVQLLVSSIEPHGQANTVVELVGSNDSCGSSIKSLAIGTGRQQQQHLDKSSTSSIRIGKHHKQVLSSTSQATSTCHRLSSCQAILVPSGSNKPDIICLDADGPRSASACAYHWPTPTTASLAITPSNCATGISKTTFYGGVNHKVEQTNQVGKQRPQTSSQLEICGKSGSTSSWRSINRLIISPVAKTWSSIQLSFQSTINGVGSVGGHGSMPLTEVDDLTSTTRLNQVTSKEGGHNNKINAICKEKLPISGHSNNFTSTTEFEEEEDILKLSSPARRQLLRNSERRMSRSCELISNNDRYAASQRFETLLIDENGEIVLNDNGVDYEQLNSSVEQAVESSSGANVYHQDYFDDKRILLATIQRLAGGAGKRSNLKPDPASKSTNKRRGKCTRCRSWSPALLDKLEDCMYQIRSRIPNFNNFATKQQMYRETTLEQSGEDTSLSEIQAKRKKQLAQRQDQLTLNSKQELTNDKEAEYGDLWSSGTALKCEGLNSSESSSSSECNFDHDNKATDSEELNEADDHLTEQQTLGMQSTSKKLASYFQEARQSRSRLRQQSSTTSDTLSNKTARTILTNVSSFDSNSSIPATQPAKLITHNKDDGLSNESMLDEKVEKKIKSTSIEDHEHSLELQQEADTKESN